MSYNMIDFTMFQKIDCNAEGHWHKTFASYHKYIIDNIEINSDKWKVTILLRHEIDEADDPKYAEIVVKKDVEIMFSSLYNTNKLEKFLKGLDTVLGAYYIVELNDDNIILTSKNKGKVPNILTPSIEIKNLNGISFNLSVIHDGTDTDVFVPLWKRNVIHIPHTTKGKHYQVPKVGDRLYFIDSVDPERDRTFTREVINVKINDRCTCDVLELDLPIDRIPQNHIRNDGLGIKKPRYHTNNYTANFEKVQVWKRREDFKEYLETRGKSTGVCTTGIGNYANMKEKAPFILNDYIKNNKLEYFGAAIHWKKYQSQLQEIYDEFGDYLCDHLFLLKSSKERPEYLVHIDYHHETPGIPVVGSLTWPAINCTNDTTTVWYDAYFNGEKIYQFGREDVTITDERIKLVEKDRFSFNTKKWNSVILNHENWHTLYNNSNSVNERMLLQWRFKTDISWEQILKITKHIQV